MGKTEHSMESTPGYNNKDNLEEARMTQPTAKDTEMEKRVGFCRLTSGRIMDKEAME